MDWLDAVTLAKFMSHHHSDGSNKPESILINGKGRRAMFTTETDQGTVEHFTERAVFEVTSDKRHRFRMSSNAGTNCAMRISVDNHTLTVIASDGRAFQPVDVDSFIIYGGERFDFVLTADQEIGNYWMRVKGWVVEKFCLRYCFHEMTQNQILMQPDIHFVLISCTFNLLKTFWIQEKCL